MPPAAPRRDRPMRADGTEQAHAEGATAIVDRRPLAPTDLQSARGRAIGLLRMTVGPLHLSRSLVHRLRGPAAPQRGRRFDVGLRRAEREGGEPSPYARTLSARPAMATPGQNAPPVR